MSPETEDWMRETMYDLRTDSPYYWEMEETLREHRREMRQLEDDERDLARFEADVEPEDDEDEEED